MLADGGSGLMDIRTSEYLLYLEENFEGVTIDNNDGLICSCGLPIALKSSKNNKPICEMPLFILRINALTWEVFLCQKTYQPDQCNNKI
jgi:hypothetical protein